MAKWREAVAMGSGKLFIFFERKEEKECAESMEKKGIGSVSI
jgi:hypothetical protein